MQLAVAFRLPCGQERTKQSFSKYFLGILRCNFATLMDFENMAKRYSRTRLT